MVSLQKEMWEEPGPYAQRPSAKLFDEWVTKAGGRVRGSLLEIEIMEQKCVLRAVASHACACLFCCSLDGVSSA